MPQASDFGCAARLLKILGHPIRLKIVCGLLGEPANLSRIARDLNIPISTLAQHLQVLRRGDILEEERSGVEVVFRVADERVPAILSALCSSRMRRGELPRWSWRDLSRGTQFVKVKR